MEPINVEIADKMRIDYIMGMGYKALSKKYGAPASYCRNVVLGRLWNEDGRVSRKPFATPEKDQRMSGPNRYLLGESDE